jgi:prolipoprotein diacylglyceryltransferase
MFPVLQIGPFVLNVPVLMQLVGVFAGVWLTEREAARLGLPADAVARMVFVGLIAGVAGARLGYVARYLSIYAADPLSLFSPNPAALDPEMGELVGGIALLIAGQRSKLPLRPTLDALTPGLAALGVALGVADLAAGDAFGAPARLSWSISLWGAQRHPSQGYEIVAALVVYGIWRLLRGHLPAAGFGLLLVVALSAGARIFLEAFRGDGQTIFGGLRVAQVWGLIVLAACLWGFYAWGRTEPPAAAHAPGAVAAVEGGSPPREPR